MSGQSVAGAPSACSRSPRENRRVSISFIMAKSSPGAIGPRMLNLRYAALLKPSGPETIITPYGLRAHDVGVVVDLDPFRCRIHTEQLRDAFQQFRLTGCLGEFAFQRLSRVDLGVLDDGVFFATPRHVDFHLAAGFQRQRFGHQCLFRQFVIDQQTWRRRLVIVKLGDERAEHFRSVLAAGVRGKERAIAVVAAAANEEHLHAGSGRRSATRR